MKLTPQGHIPSAQRSTTTGAGSVADNLNAQIARVQSGATQLSNAIDNVAGLVGGAASDIYSNIGVPTVGGAASTMMAVIGGTSSNVASALGDPGASKTLISNVGGSTTSIQGALNSLSTTLQNNTNFSSSLYAATTTLGTKLDNSLSSLPNGGTFATVSSVANDGLGGVNIGVSSGLGAANGTYNLSSATLSSGISNGTSFTVNNGSFNLVLINQSGSTISTQAQALSYLSSMYPAGAKLAAAVSDKISSINVQVGGIASSTRAKIAAIDATLLDTPTGVLSADLSRARDTLVDAPSATLQSDIQTLSALTDGAAATNSNSVWTNISALQTATTVQSQLNAFLALFNPSTWSTSSNSSITFTISGTPTSLGDLIGMASHTS